MQERFGEADTPTTQDVKDRWMHAGYAYTHAQKEAEFDRWLAARDRENRAIGWDEGHTHCFHVEDPKNEGNPYRGDTNA